MQIEVLDGVNAGPLKFGPPKDVSLTNVDYSEADYSTLKMLLHRNLTVRYDNATHFEGDNDINGRTALVTNLKKPSYR